MDNQANFGVKEDNKVAKFRKSGRKMFFIECRVKPECVDRFWQGWCPTEWYRWGQYKTEKARDEAFKAYKKKAGSDLWLKYFEYRKV